MAERFRQHLTAGSVAIRVVYPDARMIGIVG